MALRSKIDSLLSELNSFIEVGFLIYKKELCREKHSDVVQLCRLVTMLLRSMIDSVLSKLNSSIEVGSLSGP